MCGCGKPTYRSTKTVRGNVAGEFVRYLQGHAPEIGRRSAGDPEGPNPNGSCLCGCGAPVAIADRTDSTKQTISGCYVRFSRGHDKWRNRPEDVRTGICACGCGKNTPIATRSARGNVKGQPMKYVDQRHAQRKEYQIDPDTGCWLMESHRSDGYSRIRRGPRLFMGHVWFFEEYREKIPAGMTLDHLCRVRNCVNPGHMEIVSASENTLRMLESETDIVRWEDFTYTTDDATGCWNADIFQRDGYARVVIGTNMVPAHRMMYGWHRGSFDRSLHLDHLCRNRRCCNPDHLESVSRTENMRRAVEARTKYNSQPPPGPLDFDLAEGLAVVQAVGR